MTEQDIYRPESPVGTTCKDCVFAVGQDGEQYDCSAGRLKVLRERGVKVESVRDPAGGPDFFVIDGAPCLYKRTPPWEGDREKVVGEMLAGFKVRLFVVAEGEDPAETTALLADPSLAQYWKVTVVPGKNPPKRSELSLWLRANARYDWAIDWWWGGSGTTGEVIDQSLLKCKSVYHVVANKLPPADFVSCLGREVVRKGRPLLCVEGDGYYAIQTFTHRELRGYKPADTDAGTVSSPVEKLRLIGRERGEQTVWPVEALDE